jgi:hypothetical protein
MTKRNLIAYSLAGVAALGGGSFSVANAATAPARTTTKVQREANYEHRLAAAVTAGKLTSSQQSAILAEHAKLEQELATAPTTTEAERKATMKQIRSEAAVWAKTNNIKVHWLLAGYRHLRGTSIR